MKNENLGLVILLGSQYCESKYNGHHLKIQCSPIFLMERTFDDIQRDIDIFADILMTQILHTGVAVQGWDIPSDLDARLTTRAHKVYKASG